MPRAILSSALIFTALSPVAHAARIAANGARSTPLGPVIHLIQTQPLLQKLMSVPMNDFVRLGNPRYLKYNLEEADGDLASLQNKAPGSPAPYHLLSAEAGVLTAALAANPEVLRANSSMLAEPFGPDQVKGFLRGARAAVRNPRLGGRLAVIRRETNLADPRVVEGMRERFDRIFDNIGVGADTPEVLSGKKLPKTEFYRGEKITGLSVQDGIIRFETASDLVYIGMKFENGLDNKEIAKRVRADIKKAVQACSIPAVRYSVTIAGEDSLSIIVRSNGLFRKAKRIKDRVETAVFNIADRYFFTQSMSGVFRIKVKIWPDERSSDP